jgi:hypothetical protein
VIKFIPSEKDALMKISDQRGQTVGVSVGDKEMQEFANVYYINENNLYGCPRVQLDISGEKLLAVTYTGAEISLMPERSFEGLLANM